MRRRRPRRIKLAQEVALFGGELSRHFDDYAHELVAASVRAEFGEALALHAQDLVRLRAARDLEADFAFEGGDFDLGAKSRLRERHRHFADDIEILAREKVVRQDIEHDVEVARHAAALARFALAGELEPLPRIDTGRYLDRDLRAFFDLARA